MPDPVENSRVPETHFIYLAKSGCPQPGSAPKGYFTEIVPHVSRHVPLTGMAGTAEDNVWRKGSRSNMLVKRNGFEAGDIGEDFRRVGD